MDQACLERAATQLTDPIMMEWALRYYADIPPGSPLRDTLPTLWFHDLNLKNWIEGEEPEMLSLALRSLPERCFLNFLPKIAARWSLWPSTLLSPAARVLASLDPELAANTFAQSLRNNANSIERTVAVLDELGNLPTASALPLFEKLLPLTHGNEAVYQPYLQAKAFGVAVRLNQTADLSRLFDGAFTETGNRLESLIEGFGADLFAHDSYVKLCFLYQSGETTALFSELSALFEDAAPLAEMDAALSSKEPLAPALKLLKTYYGRSAQSSLAWDVIRNSKNFQSDTHPQVFTALALAAVAAVFERKTLNTTTLGTDEIFAILCLDIRTNIHYEALLARLRDLPRVEIVDATLSLLYKVINGYGGITLTKLMRDLAWSEFVPTLITCLNREHGDYVREDAERALVCIGAAARDGLIAQWDALDSSQKIYGSAVIQRVGGTAVAEFTLSRSKELLQDDIEEWSVFVQSEPDPRLIALVHPQLRRNQHDINEAFYRLCRLLGVDSPELAGLRTKLLAHRDEQLERMRNLDSPALLDPPSTLRLSLRCTSCNDINDYEVRKVILSDPESGYPSMVADEFACLSCGKITDFTLEPKSTFALLGETLRQKILVETGQSPRSSVLTWLKIRDANGSEHDAPQSYGLLQEKVRKNPDDWLSWFRLGNINNAINRPKMALACLELAYSVNPLSFDTILNLATTLVNTDQEEAALKLMVTALDKRSQWQTLHYELSDKVREFASIFNELRRNTGREYIPALHPQFFTPNSKVERNDPCPCGSGKKYKKCCMK